MSGDVLVTGAASPLGRRVVGLLLADPRVSRVVAVDRPGVELPGGARLEPVLLELTDPDLKRACEGVSSVVHLGVSDVVVDGDAGDALDGTGVTTGGGAASRALLAAAADAGVTTLVVLSSAMVYGAWANNPVPLTEDAPLRPDPAVPFAIEKAELERLAGEWRDDRQAGDRPDTAVAILRPTIAVASDRASWLSRSPWSPAGVRIDDADPPSQFVHLDDVAAAIDLARRSRLDGTFNVAPDGWISAEQLQALKGPAPRVHVPARIAERLARTRFAVGLSRTPPGVLAYTRYSWVVANDRLRSAGWEPTHTNEEAFVEADHGGPLSSLDPKRRQLLAFGVVGGVAAALVVAVVALVRRSRRRA